MSDRVTRHNGHPMKLVDNIDGTFSLATKNLGALQRIATGGTATTLVDAKVVVETNKFANKLIKMIIKGGVNNEHLTYVSEIASNTANTYTFATLPIALKSSAIIGGETANRQVAVEHNAGGFAGNDFSVVVDNSLAAERNLSAALADKVVTVKLATVGDDAAEATIGTYDVSEVATPLITIASDAAGTDGNDFFVEVVLGETTATLSAAITGDNNEILTITLANTDGDGDVAGNAASLIKSAIDALAFTATVASGQNDTRITEAEAKKAFAGGTNELNTAANTATLIKDAIHALTGINATNPGNGTLSLTLAETQQLSGGADAIIPKAGDYYEILL